MNVKAHSINIVSSCCVDLHPLCFWLVCIELFGSDLHHSCWWPVHHLGNCDWKPTDLYHPHRWRLSGTIPLLHQHNRFQVIFNQNYSYYWKLYLCLHSLPVVWSHAFLSVTFCCLCHLLPYSAVQIWNQPVPACQLWQVLHICSAWTASRLC